MNSYRRFATVYRTVEDLYGHTPSDLEIKRAYDRYIKVTALQPLN